MQLKKHMIIDPLGASSNPKNEITFHEAESDPFHDVASLFLQLIDQIHPLTSKACQPFSFEITTFEPANFNEYCNSRS